MKRPLVAAVGLALVSLAGCRSPGTYVVVDIRPGQHPPTGIRSVLLDLELDGRTASTVFAAPSGSTELMLPTSGVLSITSGAGTLEIDATARGDGDATIGTGHATVTVMRGKTASIPLVIEDDLSIQRNIANNIPFKIRAKYNVVRTSKLMFDGTIENDRVEIIPLERTPFYAVGRTKDNRFKHAEIHLARDIEAHMVHSNKLLRVFAAAQA